MRLDQLYNFNFYVRTNSISHAYIPSSTTIHYMAVLSSVSVDNTVIV